MAFIVCILSRNSNIQTDNFQSFLDQVGETPFNIDDYSSQIKAIQSHDVISKNGGSIKEVASMVKSDLMVISASKDLICNPRTAIEFSKAVGGQIHELSSSCGHVSFICETELISGLVQEFFKDWILTGHNTVYTPFKHRIHWTVMFKRITLHVRKIYKSFSQLEQFLLLNNIQ